MNFYIHDFSPIAFSLFGVDFPWYWLAYFFSFFILLWLSFKLSDEQDLSLSKTLLHRYFFFGFFIMLIFAKAYYVLFYHFDYYRSDPSRILKIWEGGMSFHGALLGVCCWTLFYSKIKNVSFWRLTDLIATVAPIGIFLGRMANFFNGELAGRITHVPWAMVFPRLYDYNPRHPSQIYEALLEGVVLFLILHKGRAFLKHPGKQSIRFLFFYGLFRLFSEFFREPDSQLGFYMSLSIGQIYSLIMILLSLTVFIKKA